MELENGEELNEEYLEDQLIDWLNPILIKDKLGLRLKVPNNDDALLEQIVTVLGQFLYFLYL